MIIKVGGQLLPTSSQSLITLPISIPFTFETGDLAAVTLPIEIPMTFTSKQRIQKKYPTQAKCVYANEAKSSKILMQEVLGAKDTSAKTEHILFDFEGLIIEEIVNDVVTEKIILTEVVQSRIAIDIENLHRDKVRVKWSGSQVPGILVYMKEQADESYGMHKGEFTWDAGYCDLDVQAYSYDIKLLGKDDSGQSAVMSIDEPFGYYVETQESISLNEKVYDIDVQIEEVHRITVDL